MCTILAAALAVFAQQAAPRKLVDQSPQGTLKVAAIEGEGAKNNIRSRTATAPVVEVKDAQDKAVAGAEVIFQLPVVGPSGSFNGWLKTQTVRTDAQGRATVSGYAPNDEAGRFNIKVTATSGSENGTVIIAQANIVGSGSSDTAGAKKKGWWKPVAIIGAAAIVGGAVAATRGGDTPVAAAASNPVVITPGAVTVAGPR
jgi:hypothetical protein